MVEEAFAIDKPHHAWGRGRPGGVELTRQGHVIKHRAERVNFPSQATPYRFSGGTGGPLAHAAEPGRAEETNPITCPKRHRPSLVRPGRGASNHPVKVVVPHCTSASLVHTFPSATQGTTPLGWEIEEYSEIVAFSHSFTVLMGSLIR